MARSKFAVLPLLFLALSACTPSTPAPKPVVSVPMYEPPPKHTVKRKPLHKPKPTQAHAVPVKSTETTVADATAQPQPQTKAIPDAGE